MANISKRYLAEMAKRQQWKKWREKMRNELDPSRLFTSQQRKVLFSNGAKECHGDDHIPVAFILSLRTRNQYLITELDPDNNHMAYGLSDLNGGNVFLGNIDLRELVNSVVKTEGTDNPEALIPDLGEFVGQYTLSEYLAMSQQAGYLVTNDPFHTMMVNKYWKSGIYGEVYKPEM